MVDGAELFFSLHADKQLVSLLGVGPSSSLGFPNVQIQLGWGESFQVRMTVVPGNLAILSC